MKETFRKKLRLNETNKNQLKIINKIIEEYKKERINKLKKQLLKYWVNEKNGLGLKRQQFILDMKKTNINYLLRTLRKQKSILYKKRRWFISSNTFEEFKGVRG